MSSYKLLINTLKVHELLLRSVRGVKLCKPDLAEKVGISEKQVDACIQFLRATGYPAVYHDERWHYSDDPAESFGLVRRDLVPRLKKLSKENIALLLMLKQGMESLKGTPFWGRVTAFFGRENQSQLTLINSQLNEIFSIRRREVEWRDPNSFERVADAVYERKQITFFYTKLAHPRGEQRTVNPCHLVCMDDIWYMLGFDVKRQAMRTFALTRIERVERTGSSFQPLEQETIQSMLHDAFGLMGKKEGVPLHTVRLRFNAFAATRIRERTWHASQEVTPLPDGGIELTLQLGQLSEVLEWILGWAEHVRVCEPPELIKLLRDRLEKTLALYGPSTAP